MSSGVGFFGHRDRFWVVLARWMVPGMMTLAYCLLVLTSDTDLEGKLWIGSGLVFVLVIWAVFRVLMQRAAIARAVTIGDAARVLELADEQLAHKRGEPARAPYHVYRALAFELDGEWAAALGALDDVAPHALDGEAGRPWRLLAAAVRISVFVETGRVVEAREVLDRELAAAAPAVDQRIQATAYLLATLARGRVLAAEGAHAEAAAVLQRVIDDVRTGARARAVAHHAAARCAEARGDAAGAARHRAQIAALAPGSWLTRDRRAA